MESLYLSTKKWCEQQSFSLIAKETLDSTQLEAQKKQNDLSPNGVVLTNQQTAGRGRNNNTWTSPVKNSALLITIHRKLSRPPSPTLPLALGLHLYSSCQKTWPQLNWGIKAPNDLFLDGKKVAGLLTQLTEKGSDIHFFLGLGLNGFCSPNNLPHSTCLSDYTPLVETDWLIFLEKLILPLFSDETHLFQKTLNLQDLENLKQALNQSQFYNEPVLKLDVTGNITFTHSVLKWFEL